MVAKAYRLLHAIFTTAVDDRLVRRNPCRVEGGGREESPERETLSLPVVFEIADAIPVRYRVLVLLATFAGLRWGELIALRRDSIDLEACEIRVVETTAQLDTGTLLPETPKSRAGRRTVAFPAELVPEIRWHLERRRAGGARAALRRSSGRAAPAVQLGRIWVKACTRARCPACTFMIFGIQVAPWPPLPVQPQGTDGRLGHSSTRAALIYQHATRDRDQAIAMAIGGLARQVGMATAGRSEEPQEGMTAAVWHVCGTTMAGEPIRSAAAARPSGL